MLRYHEKCTAHRLDLLVLQAYSFMSKMYSLNNVTLVHTTRISKIWQSPFSSILQPRCWGPRFQAFCNHILQPRCWGIPIIKEFYSALQRF